MGLTEILESALVALIILVVLLLFSPANTPILARDEGVFVYIGQGILEGKVPYRDLWDHKGPLIYYLNALGLWLGHNSLWGIWLVEAALLAASLILLYRLLRTTLSREAAVFGLLVWATGFAFVVGGNVVEEYAIPLSVASLLIALRRTRPAGFWLGVLGGLAFMLRPNEVAGPGAALLFLLGHRLREEGWRRAGASVLQFLIGSVLITAGVAWYFALQHALPELVDSALFFNLRYMSGGGNMASSMVAAAGYLAAPLLFAAAGTIPPLFFGTRTLSSDQRGVLHLSIIVLILVVPLSVLSGRVYRHYYIGWLLPLSILSSYCCLWLRIRTLGPSVRKALWVLSWLTLLLAVIIAVRIRIVPLLAGEPPRSAAQAVEAIRALKPTDKQLVIWGDETSYAVMADRKLAGRYLYTWPLLEPGYGEQMATQVLSDIARSRPLIIDAMGSESSPQSLSGAAPYPYLEPLYGFVHENYQLVDIVPGMNWPVWAPK